MDTSQRPSLQHWFLEPNPLLEQLPQIADLEEWGNRLAFSPLEGLLLRDLTPIDRHSLLVMPKMPLEPTQQLLRIAITLMGMLRGSLQLRNPIRVETRRRVFAMLAAAASGSAQLPPDLFGGFSVLLLMGVTGTGKTAIVNRFRALLPEKIIHGPCPEAGWASLTQIVHLYTNLSHDGSRGGFLIGILLQMDKILGTNYAVNLPKRYRTVERLAVATVAMMHAHYLGLLFIDEGQLKNLVESEHSDVMQLFLLSIINSGIPLVLIGNPLAFGWLDTFSQDLRRIYEKAAEFLHPIGAIDGEEVEDDKKAVFKGISSYYVLHEPVQDPHACSKVLESRSGGIPGLGLTLWCEGQRNNLLIGKEFLSPEDIEAAYSGPGFDKFRDLADGFNLRDPLRLSRYADVPYRYYARVWGKPIGETSAASDQVKKSNASGGASERSTVHSKDPARREQAKLKAKQTRERNKQAAREQLNKQLQPEDMRAEGIKRVLLDGLDAARRKVEESKIQKT